ncbi:MAG: hypothetical protein H6895_10960 [Defluviimonas sp.]|uniref:hypothetical protein n=1 Tax=Albidovulum sp. TaxID=1872424 RepID=UPI002A25E425|nr:hypothetical protein [Defluviimonas sp.]
MPRIWSTLALALPLSLAVSATRATEWYYVGLADLFFSQPDLNKVKVCVFNDWSPQNSGYEALAAQWTIVQTIVGPDYLNAAQYETVFNMAAQKDGRPCIIAALSKQALDSDPTTMQFLNTKEFSDVSPALGQLEAKLGAPPPQDVGKAKARIAEIESALLASCGHSAVAEVAECDCLAKRFRAEMEGGRYYAPDRSAAEIANEIVNETFASTPAECIATARITKSLEAEAPNMMMPQAAATGGDLDALSACYVREALAAFAKYPTAEYWTSPRGPKFAALQACQ